MLRFVWKSAPEYNAELEVRNSLKIGNLLDDPGLRRSMGLAPLPLGARAEQLTPPVAAERVRFDRRRLLEAAAA